MQVAKNQTAPARRRRILGSPRKGKGFYLLVLECRHTKAVKNRPRGEWAYCTLCCEEENDR